MCLVLLVTIAFSQTLSQVTLTGAANSNVITFIVDESVLLNVSRDGKIIDWGVENRTRRMGIHPGPLDKYSGKEEYYPETDNEAFRGKVKYIGRTLVTYYSSSENETLKGKLKSIGSLIFDYYGSYEDEAIRGNIKNAGSVSFGFYSSFDDRAFKGKIKNVGPTNITYYSSFDDKAFTGKVKSIDRQPFVYYSSLDRREYSGLLKTGSPMVFANNVKFFVRN